MATIYKIVNIITKQVYIGITDGNVNTRWKTHKKYSQNPYLRKSIKEYGIENFNFSVLCKVDKRSDALNKEDEYMMKYNSIYPKGLNYRYNSGKYTISQREETRKVINDIKNLKYKVAAPYVWVSKNTGIEYKNIIKAASLNYSFDKTEIALINKVLKTKFKND